MQDNLAIPQVLRLKGRLYTVTVIQLMQTDPSIFAKQMQDYAEKAPKLLTYMPVVLDCASISIALPSLLPYSEVLKKLNIYLIGVQGSQPWLQALAKQHQLPIFQASSNQDRDLVIKEKPAPKLQSKANAVTKMVTQPVRSGQQVVSQGGDLIVVSSVGHGAELLSDGHIHVYGPLRGRALAGIKGNKQARIFCTQLDAELVSIAGFYRLRESIPQIQGPCQIFISDDRLQIIAL
jgi:septum site-determining protein MinC